MGDLDDSFEFYTDIVKEHEESKKNIINILEKIFKNSILDIEFGGTEQFEDIVEYEFVLLKVNVFYENGKKDDIYLKKIKGGKIKESIFCYWLLLYDKFLKEEKGKIKDMAEKKAIITQITSNKSISSLLLTLNSKFNCYAEINLVELRNFDENNKKYERWLDNLGIKNEDILFIGKKMY